MIVGVTGFAQNGKDTVGGVLTGSWGYVRYSFADQLKDMAVKLNPLIPVDILRDVKTGGYSGLELNTEYRRLGSLVDEDGWEVTKKWPEARRILIELGMQVRHTIGTDAWVHALGRIMDDQLFPNSTAVITDVRFPNEAQWVTKNGGVIIRVTKLGPDGKAVTVVDPTVDSERHVPYLHAHFDIRAEDGDMAGLLATANGIASDLEEGFIPKVASTYEGRFGETMLP